MNNLDINNTIMGREQCEVTVIIPTFNVEKYIKRGVEGMKMELKKKKLI